jgi:hypothetical protein
MYQLKSMKAICIDSSNKPNKIPIEEWVVQGEVYTIIKTVKMGLQDNKYGVLLKEVQLSPDSFPYEFYDMERFLPFGFLMLTKENVQEEVTVKEADLELI